jgi:hypothetical protein
MGIDFGDISVDASADVTVENATINVGSLIALNTNPYTFAATIIINQLINIWSAAKERALLEQQIAFLKAIGQEIDTLNTKADAILKKLNELPAVLLPAIKNIVHDEVKMGRLDGYYVQLDSVSLQFETLKNFRVQPDLWAELKSSFFGICQDEFRYQKLLLVMKYTELLNFISAGKEQAYFSALVLKAAANVETFQKAQGEDVTVRYKNAVQAVADGVNGFYPLRCNSPMYPGRVDNFSAAAPHLHIAQGTKALNDILITETPPPTDQLLTAYANATITLDNGQSHPLGPWTANAVNVINSGAASPHEIQLMVGVVALKDFVLNDYTNRFAGAIARLKTFQEAVFPVIQEGFERFRELQELKGVLRAGAKIDYQTKLKNAPSHIG